MDKYLIVIGTVDLVDVVKVGETARDDLILDEMYFDFEAALERKKVVKKILIKRYSDFVKRLLESIKEGTFDDAEIRG